MNPLQEVREFVAGVLLTADLGVPVYASPVENPRLPSIQVAPAEPWATLRLGNIDARVTMVVRVMVPVATGSGNAIEALERLTWAVLQVLPPVETLRAPRVESVGTAEAYVVEITTSAVSNGNGESNG